MSKVDRIIPSKKYIIEVRAWANQAYHHSVPRAFTKQIQIPTTSIRDEGGMTVDAINSIQKLLHDFHVGICDKVDAVYDSLHRTVKEEEKLNE